MKYNCLKPAHCKAVGVYGYDIPADGTRSYSQNPFRDKMVKRITRHTLMNFSTPTSVCTEHEQWGRCLTVLFWASIAPEDGFSVLHVEHHWKKLNDPFIGWNVGDFRNGIC